ncbi:hypothetical protein Q7O_001773 [Pectobacterium carotovorum subsp. carotovorum PCCS1]|nr:hypothetical protein [Pectobacterium carotovorum subsp. carotovorum PCCS1]
MFVPLLVSSLLSLNIHASSGIQRLFDDPAESQIEYIA